MGEFGRSGPQLPHDEAAQREHLNEVGEDLRHDQEADRVAKGQSPRNGTAGYLLVLELGHVCYESNMKAAATASGLQ